VIKLPFSKDGESKPATSGKDGCEELEESHEACKRRIAVYKKIIERYREQIEMGETKTVPDLKNLVDPKNKAVLQVKQEIEDKFRPYIYEQSFLEAAKDAFEFMRDEIENEALPVDFWLYPEDVLELKIADEMDKAIFLCSILISLDNETARVVVETEGGRHAFVLFEFGGKSHLMDPVHNINISGSREEVLKEHLQGHESKVIYEFNHKGYEEW
jgi:hypothetical protein